MSTKYQVVWIVDIQAETPEQAAHTARLLQLDPKTMTTPFLVTPECGECPGVFHGEDTVVLDAVRSTSAIN